MRSERVGRPVEFPDGRVVTTIRMNELLLRRIDKHCEEREVGRNKLMVRALVHYCEVLEQQQPLP